MAIMKTWITFNWLKVLAVIFLAGAYFLAMKEISFPFAYYQYLNWAVLGAGLMLSRQANMQDRDFFVWLGILIAVTFNPFAPMYFRSDIWIIVDLVTIALFIFSMFVLKPKRG
jgi:hypothetical protein